MKKRLELPPDHENFGTGCTQTTAFLASAKTRLTGVRHEPPQGPCPYVSLIGNGLCGATFAINEEGTVVSYHSDGAPEGTDREVCGDNEDYRSIIPSNLRVSDALAQLSGFQPPNPGIEPYQQ